ncbi:MAG TPA: 50S ribosomal protein L14 [Planctomycetes bacterium]|nr:50S ribosomal protein L14 [Planctomycetota bacterium]
MIQMETVLDIADNTGAKKAKMIRVLGKSNSRTATLGDIIVAHVRQAAPGADVKKGDVVRGVIVRQRKKHRRPDGSWIRFDRNAMVILQDVESKNPKGTRIFGAVARELRSRQFTKIVSLASEVI